MTALKSLITKHPFRILVGFYIFLHVLLFNINVAEWGDSYRILRASIYIDNFTYPANEKRPPLFSALIALFPQAPDPVFWGRVTVFVLGVFTFVLFLLLLNRFLVKNNAYSLRSFYLGALLFMFNPVLFYWSLRIMSDVLFLFLVIAAFAVYYFVTSPVKKALVLGLIAGLAVLTRFEGFLLFGALGLEYGIRFVQRKDTKSVFFYLLAFLLFYIPYFLWRNPFTSSYLEEPSGRTYDVNTLLIFLTAFLFSLGFVVAPKFFKVPSGFLKANIALSVFLIVDFVLVLLWPAAVPRLLMPMLPFLIIFVVLEIAEYFSREKSGYDLPGAVAGVAFLGIYILSQVKYHQQFLVVNKYVFGVVVVINLVSIAALYVKNVKWFFVSIVASTLVWSSSIIYLHKDTYTTLVEASNYMLTNLKGKIKHNDTAAVLAWNINYRYPNDAISGNYQALYNDDMINYNKLIKERKYDYLIITNEEKPFFTFHPNDKYLAEVFSTSKYTNGALYTTAIYKIKYE